MTLIASDAIIPANVGGMKVCTENLLLFALRLIELLDSAFELWTRSWRTEGTEREELGGYETPPAVIQMKTHAQGHLCCREGL